jgi:peptidoglycan/xylan/chitin deacetylase (PgdA/CDA1 family)
MNLRPNKQTFLRLLPDSLALTFGPRDGHVGYLTFDDGPHPEFTPRILDLLAEYDARASFFLIGDQIKRFPAIVERIVAEGHRIGNHSYTHPQFDRLSLAAQIAEIENTDQLLAAFDGRPQHRFRPPRGVVPMRLLAHFVRQRRGLTYWSCDSYDYGDRPVDVLTGLLRQHGMRDGEIVLMHDDSSRAEGILRNLLPEWREAGIVLRALPE